jgi:hypothetical protein
VNTEVCEAVLLFERAEVMRRMPLAGMLVVSVVPADHAPPFFDQ